MDLAPKLYYDFWVAAPKSNPRDWKYQDWKIKAATPKQAVLVKMLLAFLDSKKNLELDLGSLMALARMSVRRIVEYELVDLQGKTKYRFKKRAEYYINEELKIKNI